MSERENIFARIREALKVEAHKPGAHGDHAPASRSFDEVLPATGKNFEECLALFAKSAADLRADFKFVSSDGELKSELAKLAAAEKWTRVATHKSQLAGTFASSLGLPVVVTDDGYDKDELE